MDSDDALSPSIAKDDPAEKIMERIGEYPAKPLHKINGVELTAQQYDDYARIAGRTARMMVYAILNTPGIDQVPDEELKKTVRGRIEEARKMAQAKVMMDSMLPGSDNNIVDIARQNKLTAMTKVSPLK